MNQHEERIAALRASADGSHLLTLDQLAKFLQRSPQGLRVCLSGNSDFARKFRPIKRKVGKRTYFDVYALVDLIEGTVDQK